MGISLRNIRGLSNIKASPKDSETKGNDNTGGYQYDPITDTGYYGVVDASELFTGSEIATKTGITEGILFNDDTQWLHFYVGSNAVCNREPNKVPYEIYIAMKPIRHTISWNHINAAGVVVGKTITSSKGEEFICRLLSGGDGAGTSTRGTTDKNEWNALMYRVHSEVPATQVGDNWASYDPNTDTGIKHGNGTTFGGYTWCQEKYLAHMSDRICRGLNGLSDFALSTPHSASTIYGWRPSLIKRLTGA